MNGLARLIAYTSKILAVQDPVDHRGFAHIGFTGKCDFRNAVLGKILGRRCGDKKFYIIEIHMHYLIDEYRACGIF
jgi:hypothetical protein